MEEVSDCQVKLMRLPGYFVALLLLQQDERFFVHRGFNFRGMCKWWRDLFFRSNYSERKISITQQVFRKNIYPRVARSRLFDPLKKIREAASVARIESMLSKHEILWTYMKRVGVENSHLRGVEDYSRLLFDKDVVDLGLDEALLLCEVFQHPAHLVALFQNKDEASTALWGSVFMSVMDLLRMYFTTWGREALINPSCVSYQDVFTRFSSIDDYSPAELTRQQELDLEVRSQELLIQMQSCIQLVTLRAVESEDLKVALSQNASAGIMPT